jgi:FMN phosphatase YigB (HAD superfamily)
MRAAGHHLLPGSASVTAPFVVMDLGGVLVRTVADIQFAALATMTGIPAEKWSAAAGDGLVGDLECGRVSFPDFAAELASRAGAQHLPAATVEDAWCLVIDGLDDEMADIAAVLASEDRLIFASNTDPAHFSKVSGLLGARGIHARCVTSHEVGCRKPSGDFFRAATSADPRVRPGAVFIDDLAVNVEAARRHGLTGYIHKDTPSTVSYLMTLETATWQS